MTSEYLRSKAVLNIEVDFGSNDPIVILFLFQMKNANRLFVIQCSVLCLYFLLKMFNFILINCGQLEAIFNIWEEYQYYQQLFYNLI